MKTKVSERLADIHDFSRKELIQRAKEFSKQFRIKDGKDFKLKDFDPGEDAGLGSEDKPLAKQALELGVEALSTLQEVLYAQDKWSVLLIFQAMDAAGKDGAIRHVMSGINPQGCQVTSYKAPSAEELDHDYLWRCTKNLPERGRIGIFNRSYYEEVLAVRVHEKFLMNQKLPEELITKDIWDDRLKDIRNFESYLNRNGIVVCKFFLNLSKKEQKKRFLARIDDPEKQWKFSASDAKERKYWDDYMKCYEELIRHTSTKDSPWYVVPADNKAFSRVVVASAVINTMDSLGLKYPKVGEEKLAELQKVKEELLAEG
ncbi:MAG TPA: polyphosphate kinase 2 family protein [Puia sp.]|nr:polyphosphate kinase 2 family protein [Puia sp.]